METVAKGGSLQQKTTLAGWCQRHEKQVFWFVLVAGAILRLAYLGRYPMGLNQDEASIGYEAYSLLTSGIDRNGQSWPVLFIAWGSGQNALYAYLSMPFIALFGLNAFSLRLVAGLLGVAALPVLYSLLKTTRGVPTALLGLVVLAANPWHVMASRWALESNIFPFFLLLGLLCVVKALQKPWWLVGAAASFGLGLYAYGTAFIFLPLFFVVCFVYLWRKKALKALPLLVAGAVFLLLAFPITLCNWLNITGGEAIHLGVITLPKLTEARQAATMTTDPEGMWENIQTLYRLLRTQSDGWRHNTLGQGHLLLPGGMLMAVVGICRAGYDTFRRFKQDRGEALVLGMLAVSAVCSVFINGNINRINYIWLPLVYFSATGLATLVQGLPRVVYGGKALLQKSTIQRLAAVYLAVGSLWFTLAYFGNYQKQLAPSMHYGLGEAIQYAETLDSEHVSVTLSGTNMPYIHVLFYNEIPPEEYISTVEFYYEGGAFELPSSFGKYTFDERIDEAQPGVVYVVRADEADALEVLAEYGYFAVGVAQ